MTGEHSSGKKKLKRLLTLGTAPRSHVKHYVVPERHAILGALCAIHRLTSTAYKRYSAPSRTRYDAAALLHCRKVSGDASSQKLDLAAHHHSAALDCAGWTHLRALPDDLSDACPHLTSLDLSGRQNDGYLCVQGLPCMVCCPCDTRLAAGPLISNDLHRLREAADAASLHRRPHCASDAEPCGLQRAVMAARLDRQPAPDDAVAGALRELGGAAATDEHPHEPREP